MPRRFDTVQTMQQGHDRLRALRRYKTLDTSQETGFDLIVREAAELCDTPIALVSLVDSNRQWVTASPRLFLRDTELQGSMWVKTIEHAGVFVVPDATQDPRVNFNPLVVSHPAIRFFAGAPLITSDAFALGTLCVADLSPRCSGLTDCQAAALLRLACKTVSLLEARMTAAH
jgi:GAF domain-containing protein